MDTTNRKRSREVRIGLVMYGGVSLAIYMNGVANELFRAVRGRGVYKLFKTLTNSDVVVDVVSGASAGGINGMFLAYALCNDREFGTCAELWRKQGDIGELLRKTGSPRESQTSLLDSEGYYEPQLAAAFREIWSHRAKPESGQSVTKELDLFVTGTDFNGRRSTAVDAAGHVIDVKDHRTTFWLKHRTDRKLQLHPAARPDGTGVPPANEQAPALNPELRDRLEVGFAAFAKLARITSCFPAAFAPVFLDVPAELPDPKEPAELAVARRLGLWGNLPAGGYHFLDGGILDNKPFTSTIETIFYRMANRPVQRHLLYVEPDPERFRNDAPRAPTFISSALDSLTRLPSYESIAGDLQQIAKHNDAVERFTRTCSELRDWVMMEPEAKRGSAPGGAAQAIYQRARHQALGELAMERLLKVESPAVDVARSGDHMTTLRRAFDAALKRDVGGAIAKMFEALDVEFRLRRLLHLTYMLLPQTESGDVHVPRRSERPGGVTAPRPARLLSEADAEDALQRIGLRVELLEIVRSQMLKAIDHRAEELCSGDPADVWAGVSQCLNELLDARGLDAALCERIASDSIDEADLATLRDALDARSIPRHAATPRTRPVTQSGSLLLLTDRGERAVMQRFVARADVPLPAALEPRPFRPIQHEYDRFEALDSILFPMQFVGNLHQHDVIRTVRVSPLDAQRGLSHGHYADKVTGESLAHFGAFLKRSWRSNDIFCGRLDGACQLLETLLNVSWLRTSLGKPEQRKRALAELGIADEAHADPVRRAAGIRAYLNKEEIFPRANGAALERVGSALAALLDPGVSPAFEERLKGQAYEELLDALVEGTHLSILADEYHKLIEDSIDEQLRWRAGPIQADRAGSAAVGPGAPRRLPRFDPNMRAFDTEIDGLALVSAAREFSERVQVGRVELSAIRQLHRDYPVGAESLERHVPRTVLLELVAHTLLIARNCILGSLGPERANAVRKNGAYRLFVDWPLRVFHVLARQLRERPARAGILLALLAYVLLAVVVNVLFPDALWELTGWRSVVLELGFVAVPLACLAFLAALLAGSEYGQRGHGAWFASVLRGAFRWIWVIGGLFALGAPLYWLNARAEPALSQWLKPAACKLEPVIGGACEHTGRALLLGSSLALGIGIGALVMHLYKGSLPSRLGKALAHPAVDAASLQLLFLRVLDRPVPVQGGLAEHKRELLRRAIENERMGALKRQLSMLVPSAFDDSDTGVPAEASHHPLSVDAP
jgi:patatin-related protein